MFNILPQTALAGIVSVALVGSAAAATAPVNIVQGANHADVNISLTVQESSLAGYDFEFVISNNSGGNGATITGMYFEAGWASSGLLSGSAFDRNLNLGGATYLESQVDPAVPDDWTSSLVSYEVRESSPGMAAVWEGIEEGNAGTIAFVGGDGVTLADLEAALGTNGFNVSMRIQDLFTADNYATGWGLAELEGGGALPGGDGGTEGNPGGNGGDGGAVGAPSPTAAAAGLALLAIAGCRRRRND